ncbi:MAG TPA: hypothetical protein VIK64_02695 [Anaerolineales bacterium]
MKWITSRVFWGLLLIAGGVIFLLENLNILEVGGLFWAVLFAIAGLGFLTVFIGDRQHWWALIPGIILLAIGSLIFLDAVSPQATERLGGVIVLGGIGLAFLIVYLVNRANWWALIPAGVMFTLAAVALLEGTMSDFETGGIFFLGLGLTFLLVALLPTPDGYMRWAFIPAGVLLLIGILMTAALTQVINIVWPLALILAGLFLVLRAFRSRY